MVATGTSPFPFVDNEDSHGIHLKGRPTDSVGHYMLRTLPCQAPHSSPSTLHTSHTHTPEHKCWAFKKHISNTSEPLRGDLARICVLEGLGPRL